MRAVTCRAILQKSGGPRCSRQAVEGRDGLCTYHYNRRQKTFAPQSSPKAAPQPSPKREGFTCDMCCEDNLSQNINMDLTCCPAKLCRDCFMKLHEIKCPFCRKDMTSSKMPSNAREMFRQKEAKFKDETMQEAARDWDRDHPEMAEDDQDFEEEQIQALQEMNEALLLMMTELMRLGEGRRRQERPQPVMPNRLPDPVRESAEDSDILHRVVDDILIGTLPRNVQRLQEDLRQRYPFSRHYIETIVDRVVDLLDLH